MTLHHLIVICPALTAQRNEFLADLLLKIQWNFPIDAFNIFPYAMTAQDFFKSVLKDF